jgi:hypothetical protein
MTTITGTHRYYSLERDTDLGGMSGTGTVAYAIELEGDGVLMLWDTSFAVESEERHSHGVEWLPSLAMLTHIHGHEGATRVEPIVDPVKQQRAEVLLRDAVVALSAVMMRIISDPTKPSWWL